MALTTGPLGGDCVQGYGDDVDLAEAPGPAGDRSLMLEQLLSERWSCRAFEDREVPRPVIERLLTLAQRSASSYSFSSLYFFINAVSTIGSRLNSFSKSA